MIGGLTSHLWHSTLFALGAGLLTIAFRRNRAKVRYWLWLSASLKFFVPFSFLIRLGSGLGWAPAAQRIATPDVSFAVERLAQPFSESFTLPPAAPAPTDWTHLAILGVWLCGLLAILSIRLRLWLRVRAAVRASTPLAIPAAVEIRSAPGLLEPGVVGWLRPILLLPEGILDRLTPSQLEAVLAHELCHVRRCDNLFAAIHMTVEALCWFHPLVWWIGARLVEERERACDESVLSLGNEPRTYADAILGVCKLYVESPLVCVSGVTGANLQRRIEAIMTNRTGQGLNRARKLLLAGAGVAALAGPVGIGVLIGVGNAPAVRAQPPAPAPPPAQIAKAAQSAAAPRAAASSAPVKYKDHRLVALLFDLDTMTSDEQSRARQAAIQFVHAKMQPADLIALMTVDNGSVKVVQDFTDDQAALESTLQNLSGGNTSSPPSAAFRLSRLETATRILGSLSDKKALMYFSSGIERARAEDPAQLQSVIDAAMRANVSFYPVDASGVISPMPQASIPQQEVDRRRADAQSKFGSTSSAMARTYIRYGPPDQIDDSNSNATVWRYNYLENFRSNVAFEFSAESRNRNIGAHIVWPPPTATYSGVPGAPAALAGELGGKPAPNILAGLPGRHASIETYPAGEGQTVVVPLDWLSGRIDISGRIESFPNAAGGGFGASFVRDSVQVSSDTFRTNFTLEAGSYVCTLIVKEQATGNLYGETINFEVK